MKNFTNTGNAKYIYDKKILETAIKTCDQILDSLDEIPMEGTDFAESVEEMIGNIKMYIQDRDRVTQKQLDTIENTLEGTAKWINHRDEFRW